MVGHEQPLRVLTAEEPPADEIPEGLRFYAQRTGSSIIARPLAPARVNMTLRAR
jgi:hypothetical protein